MPIYEYLCEECGEVTEALVRMGDASGVACAKCGSAKTRRKLSTFAAGKTSSESSRPVCSTGACSLGG